MRFVIPRANIVPVRFIALAASFGMTFGVVRADWRFEADTSAVYDSNLSNSERESDIKDDWSWHSNVRVTNGFQLTRDLRLNLSADISGQVWRRYYDFTNIRPAGSLGLRYRFGLGRTAPWVMVEDDVGYGSFIDDDRSGLDNRFRVSAGVGLTDRLAFEAGYLFEHFDARDPFWDWAGHTALARLTFDLTSSFQVSVGYSYRSGEVISYARPPRPDLVAIASERDIVDTFGFPNYTAYKLHGITNSVSVSAAYTLKKYVSIVMSYEYRNTFHSSLEYEGHVFEAKLALGY